MLESVAYMKTESGPKYLVQLCKHFAHKITVSYSESHGDCQFVGGTAALDADGQGLRMAVNAADEDGLARIQAIIESHLVRFAFREKLEALDWQRQDKAA
jgi:hypothetical protein